MKDITDFLSSGNESKKDDYTIEQRQAVAFFVGKILEMFPNYRDEMRKTENFKAKCRFSAPRIVNFSGDEAKDRIEKIRDLVAVQNMRGLNGNYKSFEFALLCAIGDMDKLNHDYRLAYPTHNRNDDAIKRIEQQRENSSTQEKALSELDKIKGLLK